MSLNGAGLTSVSVATTATPSSIRFPPSLRERVIALAAHERRSFSSQCLRLIETALEEAPPLPDREAEIVDELRRELDAREVGV